MFRPRGVCQLLTEFCKQLTKTKTSRSTSKDLWVETSCSHLPMFKAAVLLIRFHVDSSNACSYEPLANHCLLFLCLVHRLKITFNIPSKQQ